MIEICIGLIYVMDEWVSKKTIFLNEAEISVSFLPGHTITLELSISLEGSFHHEITFIQ